MSVADKKQEQEKKSGVTEKKVEV